MRSVALKPALEFAPDPATEPRLRRAPQLRKARPEEQHPEETELEDLLGDMRRDATQDPRSYVMRWEVRGGGE